MCGVDVEGKYCSFECEAKQRVMKKMENETRPKKIERELIVNGIEIIEGQEQGIISKLKISTSIGSVTWKPKVDESTYQDGFKVTKKTQARIGDIPNSIKSIAKSTSEKGSIKVKAVFMEWHKDNGIINFINGTKQAEEWAIIEETPVEESVSPPSFC